MAKMGRPTIFNQDLADKICEEIVRGKTLIKISKELGFDLSNLFKWLREKEDFSKQYARAKAEQADILIEEILEIADDAKRDTYFDDELGREVTDHEVIARSRLRVDTRKWIASKMKPKKYGDKLDQQLEAAQLPAITINLKSENLPPQIERKPKEIYTKD